MDDVSHWPSSCTNMSWKMSPKPWGVSSASRGQQAKSVCASLCHSGKLRIGAPNSEGFVCSIERMTESVSFKFLDMSIFEPQPYPVKAESHPYLFRKHNMTTIMTLLPHQSRPNWPQENHAPPTMWCQGFWRTPDRTPWAAFKPRYLALADVHPETRWFSLDIFEGFWR